MIHDMIQHMIQKNRKVIHDMIDDLTAMVRSVSLS